jgi:hypothetical protein
MTETELVYLFKHVFQKTNIYISEEIIQAIAKGFISQFNEEIAHNIPLFNSAVIHYLQRGIMDLEQIKTSLNQLKKYFGIPADILSPERIIWPPIWLGWNEKKPDLWEYYEEERGNFISQELPFIILLKFRKPLEERDLICQKLSLGFKSRDDLIYRRDAIVELLTKLGRRLFNTPCARLYSYRYCKESNKLELIFQMVEYFDTLYTNHYCDLYKYEDRDWQLTTRDILAPGPSLPSLEESKCGNDLGINLILEISDGFILLQNRSYLEAVHPNKKGPSVSGGMEYKFNTPFEAIKDEAYRELGLLPEEIEDIKLVGLGRDTERAGKPEAFFIGKSNVTKEKLKKYFIERRGQEYWELFEEGPFDFPHKTELQKIKNIIKDTKEPLVTRAALWFWLETVKS